MNQDRRGIFGANMEYGSGGKDFRCGVGAVHSHLSIGQKG